MRGKLVLADFADEIRRITPAYAGKTKVPAKRQKGCGDHPRVCGENRNVLEFENRLPGSPPRMRGKLGGERLQTPVPRITPAYAGKTYMFFRACAINRDHPRVCGENRSLKSCAQTFPGSPPRMRGKPVGGVDVIQVDRITPAYAGKTTAPTKCDLMI